MLTAVRRCAIAAIAGAAILFGLASVASAATCSAWGDVDPAQPGIQYGCVSWTGGEDGGGGGGDDGGGGGGGSNTPSCTFFDLWDEFCSGPRACFLNDPAAIQDLEEAREVTPGLSDKPDEADHLLYTSCRRDANDEEVKTYYWDSEFDEGPTLEERIVAARGALNLPTLRPVFNPPTRTLVNLDTWWWAEGASTGEVVGSEALGLRAIATPRGMTVTAGGQTLQCPVVTQRSDTCAMKFRRAGTYTATVSIAYDIRFEMNGSVIDVPTGAEDLTSITTSGTTTVPVLEVQSIVTQVD